MSDPIISEETLTSLEQLCRNAQQIAYNAQEAADQLQSAAKLLNESLKRAREMNRPVYVPPEKIRDGGGKATWKTKGAISILNSFLIGASPAPIRLIASRSNLALSTVRTYVSVLAEEGLIEWLSTGYHITDAGRAALLS